MIYKTKHVISSKKHNTYVFVASRGLSRNVHSDDVQEIDKMQHIYDYLQIIIKYTL